jgi:hypothetical protein
MDGWRRRRKNFEIWIIHGWMAPQAKNGLIVSEQKIEELCDRLRRL